MAVVSQDVSLYLYCNASSLNIRLSKIFYMGIQRLLQSIFSVMN